MLYNSTGRLQRTDLRLTGWQQQYTAATLLGGSQIWGSLILSFGCQVTWLCTNGASAVTADSTGLAAATVLPALGISQQPSSLQFFISVVQMVDVHQSLLLAED